jgi:hypothetical protein
MPLSPFHIQPQPRPAVNAQPCCPLCNGMLVPVREMVRCCQCGFTTCAGCQGGTAENDCEID